VVVGVCVGDPVQAALAAAYLSISGPAAAAVRLIGLDPLAVGAVLAGLAPQVDSVAGGACTAVQAGRLPDDAAPWLDVLAEQHARREVTLFAS